jgi:hypothetical protein
MRFFSEERELFPFFSSRPASHDDFLCPYPSFCRRPPPASSSLSHSVEDEQIKPRTTTATQIKKKEGEDQRVIRRRRCRALREAPERTESAQRMDQASEKAVRRQRDVLRLMDLKVGGAWVS